MIQSEKIQTPTKPERSFLPQDLVIDSWETIKPYFDSLNDRDIADKDAFNQWLSDRSELEAVLSEEGGWRYIRMSIDTANQSLVDEYTYYVAEIQSKMAPYENALNQKLKDTPFSANSKGSGYDIYLRSVVKSLELYRDVNVDLFTQISQESQKFGAISGAQTINYDGKELTMQMAATYFKSLDQSVREDVYRLVSTRRLKDKDALNNLFSILVELRNKVAINADYANYRDYKFDELGRFDYSVQDCYQFHNSIEQEIIPVLRTIHEKRRKTLGFDQLKPWDTEVDLSGKEALKPFDGGNQLISKTIELFRRVKPLYADYLTIMREMGHLDLESKNGKMPGGYNYPLYEIGVPFIFMNAVGSQNDLVTMIHEGGHAIHSFLSRDLALTAYKSLPSEVAELASMSIELITMEHWDIIYTNEDELKRAKRDQLEKLFLLLPWIAVIDAFQHWVYEHPEHTVQEREDQWLTIYERFSTGVIDFEGAEEVKKTLWQRQLHLFEVPFYYIEYGMAQLGAIAVWRNYRNNPAKALEMFESALSLGYTESIPEIYQTAGIKFDFSSEYVHELMVFVQEELESLD